MKGSWVPPSQERIKGFRMWALASEALGLCLSPLLPPEHVAFSKSLRPCALVFSSAEWDGPDSQLRGWWQGWPETGARYITSVLPPLPPVITFVVITLGSQHSVKHVGWQIGLPLWSFFFFNSFFSFKPLEALCWLCRLGAYSDTLATAFPVPFSPPSVDTKINVLLTFKVPSTRRKCLFCFTILFMYFWLCWAFIAARVFL